MACKAVWCLTQDTSQLVGPALKGFENRCVVVSSYFETSQNVLLCTLGVNILFSGAEEQTVLGGICDCWSNAGIRTYCVWSWGDTL